MTRLRYLPLPGYLFLCIVLGGASNGGFLANAVLQLLSVAILVWAFWQPADPQSGTSRLSLKWLMMAGGLLVAIQFLPVPIWFWELSAGRSQILEEAGSIGLEYPVTFFGLSPFEALKSALWLLPAAALAAAMLRRSEWKAQHFAWAILCAMVLSVFVGALQLAQGKTSSAYLYAFTNRGSTVGFFANSNHLATLLLVSLPFIAGWAHDQMTSDHRKLSAPSTLVAAGLAATALVGIVVNGSLAGYGLAVPVLAASAMILVNSKAIRRGALIAIPAVIAGAFWWLTFTAQGQILQQNDEVASSSGGRQEIWATSWQAIIDFAPFGSGLGTFAEVYRRYEDPGAVTTTYMNHAHNDYLELILEFGWLAIPVLIAFMIWWGSRTVRIWLAVKTKPFAMAASIASGLILVHSIVDYPLRTAAISSIFAVCLCVMATERLKHRKAQDTD